MSEVGVVWSTLTRIIGVMLLYTLMNNQIRDTCLISCSTFHPDDRDEQLFRVQIQQDALEIFRHHANNRTPAKSVTFTKMFWREIDSMNISVDGVPNVLDWIEVWWCSWPGSQANLCGVFLKPFCTMSPLLHCTIVLLKNKAITGMLQSHNWEHMAIKDVHDGTRIRGLISIHINNSPDENVISTGLKGTLLGWHEWFIAS